VALFTLWDAHDSLSPLELGDWHSVSRARRPRIDRRRPRSRSTKALNLAYRLSGCAKRANACCRCKKTHFSFVFPFLTGRSKSAARGGRIPGAVVIMELSRLNDEGSPDSCPRKVIHHGNSLITKLTPGSKQDVSLYPAKCRWRSQWNCFGVREFLAGNSARTENRKTSDSSLL